VSGASPPYDVPMVLLRTVVLTAVVLPSTGCLKYILVMGDTKQKIEASKKVLGPEVAEAREKKDCNRWIPGLMAARDKLPLKDYIKEDQTWYASELEEAYDDCLFWGLLDLKRLPGTEREKLQRFVDRIDLVSSLPLAELSADGNDRANPPVPGKGELPALRAELAGRIAEFDRRAAEKLARQTRRIDAATLAESKGWPLAALASWLSVEPLDEAMKARRDEAVSRLTPLARTSVAVPVSVKPAATEGVSPALLAQVLGTAALTRPTLRLVDAPEQASVQVQLSVGAFAQEKATESVSLEHSYVSDTKLVPNPRLETLRKDIAYHDKEAAYWRGKVQSIRCTGSGPCKPRISAQDNARREDEHAARDRRSLANEKPTIRKDVTSVYSYTGDKTVFLAKALLGVTMTSRYANAPSKVNGTAKVERSSLVYAGNGKVGLQGRTDPTPTPAELEAALTAECARLLGEAAAQAPALAAAEFDAQLAATAEPLEKLHLLLVRSLRSGQSGDAEALSSLEKSLLDARVDSAALVRVLASTGGAVSSR
jgi:hypothetical protein